MMAVNNRVRKLATSLFLISPWELMANQRAAFGRSLSQPALGAWSCCRPMPLACSDLPEVYPIEIGRPCPSSRSRACSIPAPIRACAHEYRTAVLPGPVYRKRLRGSAVPPDDNGQDQSA